MEGREKKKNLFFWRGRARPGIMERKKRYQWHRPARQSLAGQRGKRGFFFLERKKNAPNNSLRSTGLELG